MTLAGYIADPARAFTSSEQNALTVWYSDFAGDPAWEMVQRNFDRECERNDIDHAAFTRFLRRLAWQYVQGRTDPNDHIVNVFGSAPLQLPGRDLAEPDDRVLLRCMTLYALLRYNLRSFGINARTAVVRLQRGAITGKDLERTTLGVPGRPCWVTHADDIDRASPASADELRDLLGLKHVESGGLVMLRHDMLTLKTVDLALKAPTVLDGHTTSGVNWIFLKRGGAGGPTWGNTADLKTCAVGVREAVHAACTVDATISGRIRLEYRGMLQSSPSACDFTRLFANTR